MMMRQQQRVMPKRMNVFQKETTVTMMMMQQLSVMKMQLYW